MPQPWHFIVYGDGYFFSCSIDFHYAQGFCIPVIINRYAVDTHLFFRFGGWQKANFEGHAVSWFSWDDNDTRGDASGLICRNLSFAKQTYKMCPG